MRAGITEAVQATFPNETIAIDFLGPFPRSEAGNAWILTMIDTFTRWPQAIPTKDRSSASVASAIYKHWICEKSVPLKIVSDQAISGVKQLAAYMGTLLVTTSGYNPTGNSSVERFHRYLNASLSLVFDKKKSNWDDFIPSVLFSCRASINDTTGHTPFFLEPQLPLGNLFPYLKKKEIPENFVSSLVENLEEARGDFLLLRAQDAKESRLEERD